MTQVRARAPKAKLILLDTCVARETTLTFLLAPPALAWLLTAVCMSSTKRYACSAPGCSKSFVRPEHLYRHRLNRMACLFCFILMEADNSSDKPKRLYNCYACDKTFVRVDLLRRHEKRHENGMRAASGEAREHIADAAPLEHTSSGSQRGSVVDTIPSDHSQQNHQSSSEVALTQSVMDHASTLAPESFALPFTPNINLDFDSQSHGNFQMFFDSSNDMQGLSEELDWLFGTISPGQDGSYDVCANNVETANVPSFSPGSTHSYQSLTDAAASSDSLWLDIREKIMSALQPLTPALSESSFFDPVNLQKFYHIYFTNYNTHFPIVHQPSFSCRNTSPLLLLAILTLGATLSDQEHFETSQAIHERLRWLIFSVSILLTLSTMGPPLMSLVERVSTPSSSLVLAGSAHCTSTRQDVFLSQAP